MKSIPHFLQECPTCGRPVRVVATLLGRRVVCGHCNAPFIAREDQPHQGSDLLRRAEELLNRADSLRERT